MKILLLNDLGTPTGGAELQMLSLRQNLRDRGHDARLLSSRATPVADTKLLADYSCFGSNSRLQVLTQTVNPSAYSRLRQILHDFQPDVVHVRIFMGQLSPLILPLLRDVPCLYQMAMYRAICPKGTNTLPDGSPCQVSAGSACLRYGCMTPQSWAILMVQRQLWQRWRGAFDLMLALSYAMKAQLEAAGITPVQVVYNGVPFRSMRSPLASPPTVAFAGRLVPEKGVSILLQAFARACTQVPQARLLIAGQGGEEAALRTLAAKLGVAANVTWLGHLPRTDMEKHFDSAWVQVIPSLWAEPFGNVTTEAMMRGTAVIASTVGAQPEIVSEGTTGFLYPPHDVEALTAALLRLLLNPEKAEQMGQAGHQRACTHFSEDRCTEEFLEIYQELRSKYQ
ncbi:MAG: glycosyltransferase family 4 protein [Cyanomargarita calcarea GSE-NOS-MK-12-04C]|jgi:glycosyltransferase involved in cell wall biosynthesis|uniref:Glycosyltransferase family 4 protein n=1 Tax=Cyanomargarita calcarea GSE-NOS-MK-12-04C TaxID=2839659 RepID=A0A951QQY6_9CYAN|nr:glycosyltransferase family 4 protein [Cyanomargarita calcarea GSE-NOS-MK-12-04C]